MTKPEALPLKWWVSREEGIYVERRDVNYAGEVGFATEQEAVEFAINCCDDWIQTMRGSRRDHAARLRQLKRAALRATVDGLRDDA